MVAPVVVAAAVAAKAGLKLAGAHAAKTALLTNAAQGAAATTAATQIAAQVTRQAATAQVTRGALSKVAGYGVKWLPYYGAKLTLYVAVNQYGLNRCYRRVLEANRRLCGQDREKRAIITKNVAKGFRAPLRFNQMLDQQPFYRFLQAFARERHSSTPSFLTKYAVSLLRVADWELTGAANSSGEEEQDQASSVNPASPYYNVGKPVRIVTFDDAQR